MKSVATLLLGLSVLGSGAFLAQGGEPVDEAAIERIRDEGLNRSQVMDTAFWLTDRYGPRLNGSPEFEEAGDWVVERLQRLGRRERAQGTVRVGPGLVARQVSRDDGRAARHADHRHAEGLDARHRWRDHRGGGAAASSRERPTRPSTAASCAARSS